MRILHRSRRPIRNGTIAAILALSQLAAPGEVRGDITVEHKLDRRTREMIAHLPEELREQVVQAYSDLQKKVGSDLLALQQGVDESISRAVWQLQCVPRGLVKQMTDALDRWTTFAKPEMLRSQCERTHMKSGNTPATLQLLKTQVCEARRDFTDEMHPGSIAELYSELTLAARDARCRDPQSDLAVRIYEIEASLNAASALWDSLDRSCEKAGSCLALEAELTRIAIEGADERDVAAARPTIDQFPEQMASFQDLHVYEEALHSHQEAQSAIDESRTARHADAERQISNASRKLDSAKASLKEANRVLSDQGAFENQASAVARRLGEAQKSLAKAKAIGSDSTTLLSSASNLARKADDLARKLDQTRENARVAQRRAAEQAAERLRAEQAQRHLDENWGITK